MVDDVATTGDCPNDAEGVYVTGALRTGTHLGVVVLGEYEVVGVDVAAYLAVESVKSPVTQRCNARGECVCCLPARRLLTN